MASMPPVGYPAVKQFIASPNVVEMENRAIGRIILHYTDGGAALGVVDWFSKKSSRVSTHRSFSFRRTHPKSAVSSGAS